MSTEALRSVFAELGFDVDLSALDAADAAVSGFAAKVERVAEEVARTITIGGVEYDAGSWQAHVEGLAAQQAQASAQAEEDARRAVEERLAGLRENLARQAAQRGAKALSDANKKSWAEAAKRDEAQRKRAGSILGRLGIDFDGDALDKGTKRVDDFVSDIKKRMAAAFGQKVFAGLTKIIPGASGLAQRLGLGAGEFAAFGQLVSRVALGIVGAFALATVAAFSFANGFAQATEQLRDTARTLQVSTGELQAFRYMADQSGLGAQRMDAALTALHTRLENIELHRGGSGALRRLGVAARDASGNIRPATDVMRDLGVALDRVTNPVRRARIEYEIFGSEGRRVGETLREQAAHMDEFNAHIEALGGGTLPEAVEASRQFTQAQGDFRLATESVRSVLFTALAPTLTWLTEKVALAAGWFSRMTRGTRIFQIALVALGTAGAAALAPLAVATLAATWPWIAGAVAVAGMLLVIEDLVGFMEGRPSLFGDFLDGIERLPEFELAIRAWRGDLTAVAELFDRIGQFLDRNAETLLRVFGGPLGGVAAEALGRYRGTSSGAQSGTSPLPAPFAGAGGVQDASFGAGGGRSVTASVQPAIQVLGGPRVTNNRFEIKTNDPEAAARKAAQLIREEDRRQRDITHPTAENEG